MLSADVAVTLNVSVVSMGENSVIDAIDVSPLSSQNDLESPKFTVM